MDGTVTIQLLGGFAVHVDGRQVTTPDFERRTGAELIQVLALEPARRLHREQVMDRLWPELRPSSAANMLNKAASFARSGLGDRSAIVVQDQIVHLFPQVDVAIDVAVVERARAADPASVARAREAYRGDLLPESPYAEWVAPHRNRLRLRYLDLLREVGAWEELAEREPTHEQANVELMRASLVAGDRAAAIRRYDTFAMQLRDELGLEPGPEAVALRDRAVAGPPAAPARADGQASTPPTVRGRDEESAQVLGLLDRERIVTIVGPGGIGKTHLATALVRMISAQARPAVVVSLGTIDDTAGALQEVLASLDTAMHSDTGKMETVTRTIGDDPVVVVLDNCEHIVDGVRSIAKAVLDACPHARILATSRVPIGLDSEHVVRLGPLPRASAIELFMSEAARHGVALERDDPLVDTICATLDDLPLALRLAGARTRSTDLEFLAAILDRNIGVLSEDTTADRERTLRETVHWSFGFLAPSRRKALGALSAFADRFDLDGARAVLAVDDATLLRVLDDLVESSLVVVERHGGRTRYRLLEAIRYFAREGGLTRQTRQRHLAHVRALVEQADTLLSSDSGRALESFAAIWADLRYAIATAVEFDEHEHGHGIIAACATYANLCLKFDALDWSERLLATSEIATDPVHAEALAAWANLLAHRLEFDRAAALISRIDDTHLDRPAILFTRGWLAYNEGELETADELLARASDAPHVPLVVQSGTLTLRTTYFQSIGVEVGPLAERIGVLATGRGPVLEAHAAFTAGLAAAQSGGADALHHLDRALEIAERWGLNGLAGGVRAWRSLVLGLDGKGTDALGAMLDLLRWAQHHGVWTVAMAGLTTVALMLEGVGQTALAVRLLAASGSSGFVSGRLATQLEATVDRARHRHPEQFPDWWAAGKGLDPLGATRFGIATLEQVLAGG